MRFGFGFNPATGQTGFGINTQSGQIQTILPVTPGYGDRSALAEDRFRSSLRRKREEDERKESRAWRLDRSEPEDVAPVADQARSAARIAREAAKEAERGEAAKAKEASRAQAWEAREEAAAEAYRSKVDQARPMLVAAGLHALAEILRDVHLVRSAGHFTGVQAIASWVGGRLWQGWSVSSVGEETRLRPRYSGWLGKLFKQQVTVTVLRLRSPDGKHTEPLQVAERSKQ